MSNQTKSNSFFMKIGIYIMKLNKFIFVSLFTLSTSFFGYAEEIAAANEEINVDQISETLGHMIVRHLQNPGFEFNVDKIVVGMQNEKAGKPSPLTEEEYEQTITLIQENLFLQTAEKNLTEANAFLEKNATEKGVVSLDPKIQYKISVVGSGAEVTAESTPLIHYTGKLLNGTVFATSKETDSPISLPIKQTIPGFNKGLVGMKEGEKRTLFIHPEMAYGVAGHLPPNSLLIFEVEIIKADAPAAENTSTAPTAEEEVTPAA